MISPLHFLYFPFLPPSLPFSFPPIVSLLPSQEQILKHMYHSLADMEDEHNTRTPTATRVPRYGEACAFLPPTTHLHNCWVSVRHNTYSNSFFVVSSCGCVQVWWVCSLVPRLRGRRETFHSSHAAWVQG